MVGGRVLPELGLNGQTRLGGYHRWKRVEHFLQRAILVLRQVIMQMNSNEGRVTVTSVLNLKAELEFSSNSQADNKVPTITLEFICVVTYQPTQPPSPH